MKDTTHTNLCARAEEIVAYFYGEMNAIERRGFAQHLEGCAACRDELTAFSEVSEAIGAWRAEILSAMPALSFGREVFAPSPRVASEPLSVISRQRSARAALREFFTLSPAWLRIGAVATALLLCTLAAFAVMNAEMRRDDGGIVFSTGFVRHSEAARSNRSQVAPPRVESTGPRAYTEAEVNQLIAQRDEAQRQLAEAHTQLANVSQPRVVTKTVVKTVPSYAAPDPLTLSAAQNNRRNVAPGSRVSRRQQIVRYSDQEEENLPRLSDLLGTAN